MTQVSADRWTVDRVDPHTLATAALSFEGHRAQGWRSNQDGATVQLFGIFAYKWNGAQSPPQRRNSKLFGQ